MNCERHNDIPENEILPDAEALEHLLFCMTGEQRAQAWSNIRASASAGSACHMVNHQGLLQSQATYTAKLLTGIREIIEQAEGPQSKAVPRVVLKQVADKLKVLIS